MAHYYLTAPFGMVTIQLQHESLLISLSSETPPSKHTEDSHPLIQLAVFNLNQYFASAHNAISTVLSVDTMDGTPYQRRVWQAIADIPSGETRSYGAVAETIGSCPRAVANACGANKLPILIPCHRVVSKHGIGGFMRGSESGLAIKRWLLAHEGIHYE